MRFIIGVFLLVMCTCGVILCVQYVCVNSCVRVCVGKYVCVGLYEIKAKRIVHFLMVAVCILCVVVYS
jgi:hypothetical protein